MIIKREKMQNDYKFTSIARTSNEKNKKKALDTGC